MAHDRCNSIPIPEAFETISEFAWNGVLTSAIDDVLIRGFANRGAMLSVLQKPSTSQQILEAGIKLHVWCFFGNVASPESAGWPPLTQLQFVQRKGTATVLASAVPELLTSLGILCIEGYGPSEDWLGSESLYQFIANLGEDQTHLFSATEYQRNDPLLRALADEGKVTFHNETLAQFLLKASNAGWITLGQTPAETEFGKTIRVAGRGIQVPEQYLRLIQTTGRIITEMAFAPLKPQNRDARYTDFRHFLYQSSYHPEWEGYARGFAFKRPFQAQLWQKVQNQVDTPSLRREPVIVHGPTGSGKTVATRSARF